MNTKVFLVTKKKNKFANKKLYYSRVCIVTKVFYINKIINKALFSDTKVV